MLIQPNQFYEKQKNHLLGDLQNLKWWSVGDSNPGPPACKAGALAN